MVYLPYPSEKSWSESQLGWFFHSQDIRKVIKFHGSSHHQAVYRKVIQLNEPVCSYPKENHSHLQIKNKALLRMPQKNHGKFGQFIRCLHLLPTFPSLYRPDVIHISHILLLPYFVTWELLQVHTTPTKKTTILLAKMSCRINTIRCTVWFSGFQC